MIIFPQSDIPRDLLYWADSGLHTISRVTFDGKHRKTVVESNGYLDRPFGLAVFEVRVTFDLHPLPAIPTCSKPLNSVSGHITLNLSVGK